MIAEVAISANYTDNCKLCSEANLNRRSRPQAAQNPDQLRARQADAAVRGVAAVVVQEDRGASAGDCRRSVVLHERELAVRDGAAPERFARAGERRLRPARDVTE